MYAVGDKVRYAGLRAEMRGMLGEVKGPGSDIGRHFVRWGPGMTVDMSDTVLEMAEKAEGKTVAQIKLDLIEVYHVQQYADRSVDVHALDRVRGEIVIRAQENTARWLHAQLCDMVRAWNTDDDAE